MAVPLLLDTEEGFVIGSPPWEGNDQSLLLLGGSKKTGVVLAK